MPGWEQFKWIADHAGWIVAVLIAVIVVLAAVLARVARTHWKSLSDNVDKMRAERDAAITARTDDLAARDARHAAELDRIRNDFAHALQEVKQEATARERQAMIMGFQNNDLAAFFKKLVEQGPPIADKMVGDNRP